MLTYTVYITLHTRREIVIDNFSDPFKIHTASHDFSTDHHPAFPSAHATDSILPLFFAHSGMQAIYIRYAAQDELFC